MQVAENKPLFNRRSLVSLIGPLLVEQALAVTIGMADTVMVSGLGEAAVSSISLVDSISVLLIQVFSALAAGGAVVVSQYVGSRDQKNACAAANQLFQIAFLCAMVIAIPSLLFNRAILGAVFGELEPAVMSGAMTYYALCAVSYPFLAVYNSGAAVFRSMGNSRVSMYASIVMNIVNVAGNALLIFVVKIGVAGAGISTLISRALGAVILTALLCKKNQPVHLDKVWQFRFTKGIVSRILRMGVPNGLENGMFQIGKLLVMRLIAGMGTAAIAANAIGNTLSGIAVLPGSGIGLGMVTVVGQCMGARRPDEAAHNTKLLMIASHALMLITCSIEFFFAHQIIGLFELSEEAYVMAVNVTMFYDVCSFLFWPESFTLPCALRGAGDARFTMIVSMLSMWIFRIGFSFLLVKVFNLGLMGVWEAMVIDWLARIVCFIIRFARGKWRSIQLI